MRLFPPNPKRIYSVPTLVGDWIVQIKYDGRRAVIECFDGEFKVFGKAGQYPLAATKGYDWSWIKSIFGDNFILDGEVIGPRQAGEPNNRLVVWDAAWIHGNDLTKLDYKDRMIATCAFIGKDFDGGSTLTAQCDGMMLRQATSFSAGQWEHVRSEALARNRADEEGLVFKRADHCLCWHPRTNQETYNMLKLKFRS